MKNTKVIHDPIGKLAITAKADGLKPRLLAFEAEHQKALLRNR